MIDVPINPGGTLSPEHVVGRDELIARLWTILEQQSIALLAPRRVGKTSICRRMAASPPPGVAARWRDLEGLDTGEDFVRLLFEDCESLFTKKARTLRRARQLLESLTGTVEVKGLRFGLAPEAWGRVLDALFADLAEAAAAEERRVVLFWDEFTWFLSDLIEKGRPAHATTLLDRLRAARQAHAQIRMVLTGSIGMHLVLRRLAADGYGNRPVNDVSKQIVPLLAPDGARKLARALLANIDNLVGSSEALAARLAEVTEGHPLLLHSVAQRLKFAGEASSVGIDAALHALLRDEADPLELSHFLDRLAGQLDPQAAAAARELLDVLAPHRAGLTGEEVAGRLEWIDRETFLRTVDILRRDHYVLREDGRLRFRLDFLRRYWCLERMLVGDAP